LAYGCETYATTKGYHNKLSVLERKIFGQIYNTETKLYMRGDTYRLANVHMGKSNIFSFIRRKRLEWFGDHVWRTDGKIIKRVTMKKFQGKGPWKTLY